MQLVLFDDAGRSALYPFTHTRPAADIRCGVLTARERWMRLLQVIVSFSLTEAYLQGVFPAPEAEGEYLLINGQLLATASLAEAVSALQIGAALFSGSLLIAARMSGALPDMKGLQAAISGFNKQSFDGDVRQVSKPWDIFSQNDWALRQDYALLTTGKASAPVPPHVTVSGGDIFIEEGAVIGAGTIINTLTGPVYVGKHAEIMEGSVIRGPFAICEEGVVKMSAKIYGGTTIGPGCKVGGEVSNTVFFANSNKAHDGFLGNAVIGEWCNLGADTNCSNLKNNYDEVKVWDEANKRSVKTGLNYCGLLMGDHSKCGINTMFNTGTVAGVSCNIWGGGFPEKFLPSFCWGGPDGMTTYQFERAMETANRMMARRGKAPGEAETAMLRHVFESTAASRTLLFAN